MSRKVSKDDLRAWQSSESLEDDLHCYFMQMGTMGWTDITYAWLETSNLMFSDAYEVEEDSPDHCLASAAIAHAYASAYAEIAEVLGIDNGVLTIAVEDMLCNGGPKGFDALKAAVDMAVKRIAEIKASASCEQP